ncbi:GCFC-domain-containing protein [Pisolithus albus]|nr:GCFC-domain-containing protein [Pisolithus albus]
MLVFKKSKARPGQRTREAEEETVEEVDVVDQSPISIASSKAKNKAKRAKAKSKLSFGGGDEDDADAGTFQLKKSSLSRKLTLGTHPANAPPDTLDQATIGARSNGAPVYDAAHLSELKASMQSTRPPMPDHGAYDVDVSMDLEDQTVVSLDTPATSGVSIPTQSHVQAAREKRERLRAIGPEQDYISLAVTTLTDTYQGPHPESRLMREEDELGEGDDEYAQYTSAQERIALGKKSRKIEASKRKDAMQEMIADADEEDEETIEWEREQLRRGGLDPFATADAAPEKQVYKAAPIPPPTNLPELGPAIERLAQSLAALKASHTSNVNAAASFTDEQEQLDNRETELRDMVAQAETKRSWFADFKEWMESVATFLDEKYPELERLESEHVSVLNERAGMITQRRKEDDEDDLSVVFGTPPQREHQPDELDELGRAVPRADPVTLRKVRRVARVARRKHRRSRNALSEDDCEEEGYSTDSSLPPSDAQDYRAAIQRITTGGEELLSDVAAAEFKDPNLGLAKWFGEWRHRYGDSYTGAWGGLGLVGAWEFWVRLELLGWNPLDSSDNLDDFSWYSALHEYSQSFDEDENADTSEPPPDGDLVSAMISTAVVPRFCKMLESGVFDPYSAHDVKRIIDVSEQIEASIGADHHKFLMILKSVHSVFENATIAAETLLSPFLRFNRPQFDPEAIAARNRLLTRASKLVGVMLRWRKYAGDKLGAGALCVRLINNYALPIARSGWEVGGEQATRQMVDALPQDLAASVKL